MSVLASRVEITDEGALIRAGSEALLGVTSRRQLFTIAGSTLVASLLHGRTAYGQVLPDLAPPDEGFFFVIPGKKSGGGPDLYADRIFFISANWLPYFEVTNLISQPTAVSISQGTPAGTVQWTTTASNPVPEEDDFIVLAGASLPDPLVPGDTYKVGTVTGDTFVLLKRTGQNQPVNANGTGTGIKVEKKKKVVDMFKGSASETWTALYSDDIPPGSPYNLDRISPAIVQPLDPPNSGMTYLAMSIV